MKLFYQILNHIRMEKNHAHLEDVQNMFTNKV